MKGGIEPFALLLVGLFGTIIISGIGFMALFNRTNISKRAMIETNVIDGINKLELTKIGLSQSLKYSFYHSSYLVSSQGGYYNLGEVDSYNCIPYWRIYDDTVSPDYKTNVEQVTLSIFNNYATSLKDETQTPNYNSITIEKTSEGSRIKATGNEKLKIVREKLTITDDSEFTTESGLRTIRLFEIGKGNFVDTDSIGDQIKNIPTYSAAVTKISSLENELNSESVGYNQENVKIELIPSQNLGLDDSNYAIRILVKIKDDSQSYPVYDYSGKKAESKNIELNFYVVVGNYQIDPQKNDCKVKEIIQPSPPSYEIIDYPVLSSKYDNTRFGYNIDRLVFHYTAGDLDGALYDLAKNPSRDSSVHYIIDRDGTIYRLVSEEYSAWHAGCSASSSDCIFSDINPRSVGIEIINYGSDCQELGGTNCIQLKQNSRPQECSQSLTTTYWERYTDVQIQTLIKLSADIIKRNPGIKVDRTHIIGHEEVVCTKSDPGPAFPWNEVISGIQNELNG